jgi:hypothetical protein
MAKKMKGISIRERLKSKSNGILLNTAVVTKSRKKATKAGQRVMGVDTETEINARTVRIFTCAGSECATEWRWR